MKASLSLFEKSERGFHLVITSRSGRCSKLFRRYAIRRTRFRTALVADQVIGSKLLPPLPAALFTSFAALDQLSSEPHQLRGTKLATSPGRRVLHLKVGPEVKRFGKEELAAKNSQGVTPQPFTSKFR